MTTFAGSTVQVDEIDRVTVFADGAVSIYWNEWNNHYEMPIGNVNDASGKAMYELVLSAKRNGRSIYLTYYANNVAKGSWVYPDRVTSW